MTLAAQAAAAWLAGMSAHEGVGSWQQRVPSVVVVVEVVVVVVVVGTISGAHSTFGTLGVRVREPNWSLHVSVGGVPFGHLSL
jgi:hypothetical protein